MLWAYALTLTTLSQQLFVQEWPVRDFTAFYLSAEDYANGDSLYLPRPYRNLNPPHVSVLLFTPLLIFTMPVAAVVFQIVNVAALAWSVRLVTQTLALSPRELAWIGAVLLASMPAQHQLQQGQVGGILALSATCAWVSARQRKPFYVSLAAATSFKPWMGAYLILQSRGAAVRTVSYGVIGIVISVLLVGLSNWQEWYGLMETVTPRPLGWNLSWRAFLRRFHESWTLPPAWIALWALGCVLLSLIAWIRRGRDRDRQWLLVGLTVLLILPFAWVYYLLVLIGPLIAWGRATAWPLMARVALAGLCSPPLFMSHDPVLGSGAFAFTLLVWVAVVRSSISTSSDDWQQRVQGGQPNSTALLLDASQVKAVRI